MAAPGNGGPKPFSRLLRLEIAAKIASAPEFFAAGDLSFKETQCLMAASVLSTQTGIFNVNLISQPNEYPYPSTLISA